MEKMSVWCFPYYHFYEANDTTPCKKTYQVLQIDSIETTPTVGNDC